MRPDLDQCVWTSFPCRLLRVLLKSACTKRPARTIRKIHKRNYTPRLDLLLIVLQSIAVPFCGQSTCRSGDFVPFWGQPTYSLSDSSPKRDCSPERLYSMDEAMGYSRCYPYSVVQPKWIYFDFIHLDYSSSRSISSVRVSPSACSYGPFRAYKLIGGKRQSVVIYIR